MARTLLEVKNLRTYFFTRWGVSRAVDDVSFALRERETLGLVGESGCGKSVTCLSILRLVPRPAGRIIGGEILLEGEDLLQKSEREMREIRGGQVSMILQDPLASLNPVFTVGNQLLEAIPISHELRGHSRWDRAKEMLRLVRIPSPEMRLRNWPHELSGGMRQRVVGAIAMARQPHLLIADEPTTSLDVTIQAQYLSLLREIQREAGVSIIFVTHDFGIVARMCGRVAVMYAGKIVEMAGTMDLFSNPLHPYSMALMRSVPKVEERVERLDSIEGEPPLLHALPQGCRFAPRCPSSFERCAVDMPPLAPITDERSVSCWLYKEVLTEQHESEKNGGCSTGL